MRECVGIDCSKDTLDVCFGAMGTDQNTEFKGIHQFANNHKGFAQLVKWAAKFSRNPKAIRYVVEVTGVYYESLAYYLYDQQKELSVVLPTHSYFFKKTLTNRTVNDKEMSKALAQMGLERKLEKWKKPDAWWKSLKELTREREELLQDKTSVSNRLHAYKHSSAQEEKKYQRLNQHLDLLGDQIEEIEKQIHLKVKKNSEVKSKINQITSIPGVGLLTAVTILAETDGFNLIRSRKQLVCYAGYDVIRKESGTSVRGQSHISKRGNSHIRRALYMPATCAARFNYPVKNLYARVVAKSGIKMKGNVAAQRKLLLLIYAIWKNGKSFDPTFSGSKKVGEQKNAPPTRASKVSPTAMLNAKKNKFSHNITP
jgi:transposase